MTSTSYCCPTDLKALLIESPIFAGWYPSPYGQAWIHATPDYLLGLYFCNQENEQQHINNCFAQKYNVEKFVQDDDTINNWGQAIFQSKDQIVAFKVAGSIFQRKVWRELSAIPYGQTTTYGQIALAIAQPKAVRAVGTAVGANPLSFVIPCHRVVRHNGDLGGYRWGQGLKQRMLEAEARI